MIFSEEIRLDRDLAYITRQKNGVDKEWYGITLVYKDDRDSKEGLCDNEKWLVNQLYADLLQKYYDQARLRLMVDWDKKKMKKLEKLLRKADELGWFDDIPVDNDK